MTERDLPPFEDSFGSDSSDDGTVFDEKLREKMMGNIRARIEPMTFEELANRIGEEIKPDSPMRELDMNETVMLTVWQAGHGRLIENVNTDGQEAADFEKLFNTNPTDVPPEEV